MRSYTILETSQVHQLLHGATSVCLIKLVNCVWTCVGRPHHFGRRLLPVRLQPVELCAVDRAHHMQLYVLVAGQLRFEQLCRKGQHGECLWYEKRR